MFPLSPSSAASQNTMDPLVKNVTIATFMTDVMEASKERPVVVLFTSVRSAACKQMEPWLEKHVRAQKGAAHLAKIDIDRDPEIAQQMQVQSIPAVFAFFRGQPVDGFMGGLPDAQIKTWLERLVKATGGAPQNEGAGIDHALKQAADFLAAGETATAHSIYADILEMEPTSAVAYAGVLRSLVALGQTEDARKMLDQAPAAIAKDKALDAARTAIELAEQAKKSSGSLTVFEKRLEENPNDHQARFDLALGHYAAGNREEAVDALLDIVRRDRKWNEDGARKQLVKLFEAFGPTDPLTIAGRKRLSSILFS